MSAPSVFKYSIYWGLSTRFSFYYDDEGCDEIKSYFSGYAPFLILTFKSFNLLQKPFGVLEFHVFRGGD